MFVPMSVWCTIENSLCAYQLMDIIITRATIAHNYLITEAHGWFSFHKSDCEWKDAEESVKQYYNRKKSFEMCDNLDYGFLLHSNVEGSLSAQVSFIKIVWLLYKMF